MLAEGCVAINGLSLNRGLDAYVECCLVCRGE